MIYSVAVFVFVVFIVVVSAIVIFVVSLYVIVIIIVIIINVKIITSTSPSARSPDKASKHVPRRRDTLGWSSRSSSRTAARILLLGMPLREAGQREAAR